MNVNSEGRIPIKMWTDGVEVEAEAMQQLTNLTTLPFVVPHIAAMPDVHWGMGATVGSVIPSVGAIIPAAVGVDIGCGMMAVKTNLTANDLPDNLSGVRSAIEAAVPHGRSDNGDPRNDVGANKEALLPPIKKMDPNHPIQAIYDKYPRLQRALDQRGHHLGTLGTGNHFIELCLDESNNVWIMLHSGSRGMGNAIGTHFISMAKEEMEKYFIHLPDKDLAYIPQDTKLFSEYITALNWAQEFARHNRELMMNRTYDALTISIKPQIKFLEKAINCHHNYVARERHFGRDVWLTRKGAVNADKGVLGIIPGSMGAKSFIVEGLGNRESFCSCSHGAGRKMSRAEAKRTFSQEDHIKATAGIECRKDEEVIDETPGAYKDIDKVMAAQTDLVVIKHTLKQIVCVKG